MAQFLRGKQAGIQKDLSAGLDPGLFSIDDIARYGINSQISTLAYEPVQSLLAVGTNESQFGGGQIYVFGKDRVSLTLSPLENPLSKQYNFVPTSLSASTRRMTSLFTL